MNFERVIIFHNLSSKSFQLFGFANMACFGGLYIFLHNPQGQLQAQEGVIIWSPEALATTV